MRGLQGIELGLQAREGEGGFLVGELQVVGFIGGLGDHAVEVLALGVELGGQ